ncbi:MAG: kelch repeat-containing protein, partial [Candidatus Omnitrophota bacterium]|nr:kelch repeat-containing protein [Candidatus Omnitrophota bacterium]
LYNTTTNAYNVYNGTSWGAVGGGSGDVLTTSTNTFTATTASPILLKPSSAPTANTKLLDLQATGAGTTLFSVDAEGDVLANSLDLTTPLPDAEVADTITAANYLPLAGGTMTGNLVIPNAGTLGQAAGPLLTFDDTNNELEISGGNVGIGTTAPAQKLEIGSGNLILDRVANDTTTSYYIGTGGTTGAITVGASGGAQIEFQNVDTAGAGNASSQALHFITHSSGVDHARRMTIDKTGNVGIGTATPGQKLTVAGTIESTSGGLKFPDGTTQTTAAVGPSGWTDDGATVRLTTVTDLLGVGTTSPAGKLHVVGRDDTADTVAFMPGTDTATAGTPDMKVGIGTTAPTGAKLQVDGGDLKLATGSAATEVVQRRLIGVPSGTTYALGASGGAAITFDQITGQHQEIAFETHYAGVGHAERMRIDKAGNVGIGTASPAEKLHVEKGATAGYVFLGGVSGGQQVGLYADGNAGYLGTKSNHPLWFFTNNGSAQMALTTAGNVGIGTASPTYHLDLLTPAITGAEKVLRLSASDATTTDFFTIENGTTVAGRFVPTLTARTTAAASATLQLIAETNTTQDTGANALMNFFAYRNDSGVASDVATRPLYQWWDSDTALMTMDKAGNVGIGTASPTATLSLGGVAADPSSPGNGSIWYSSAEERFKVRMGGLSAQLAPLDFEDWFTWFDEFTGSTIQAAWAMLGGNTWTQLSPTGGPPAVREDASAVFDGATKKMYVFGGLSGATYLNDLWVYEATANTWTSLSPTGAPAARSVHSAVFDGATKKMYVFGGWNGTTRFNDLWVYDATANTWTQLTPTGPPSGRSDHTAVYDATAKKMYLFGGTTNGGSSGSLSDLWIYDVAAITWTQLSPTGGPPGARGQHSAAFDSATKKMYIFGGWNVTALNNLWVYDVAANTWTSLTPTGGPSVGRAGPTAVYDSTTKKMHVFGGYDGTNALSDLWVYEATANTWTQLTPTGPPGVRWTHAAVFDEISKMYVFSGWSGSADLNDLWVYDVSAAGLVDNGLHGLLQQSSVGAAGTDSGVVLARTATSTSIDMSKDPELMARLKKTTSSTGVRIVVGFVDTNDGGTLDDLSGTITGNGVYYLYDPANTTSCGGGTTWRAVTRTAGTGTVTCTDTTVTVTTDTFNNLRLLDLGTTVKFFVDGTERTSGGITTNIPTAALRPVLLMETTDTTPDAIQVDYVSLRAKR